MTKRIAFLFPGQGSQYVGMGKDFFDEFAVAKETFLEADECLEFNLSRLIFNGPEDKLTETRHSQAAIFVTSMAILNVVKQQYPNLKPSVCAGLSLGEYSALVAADRVNFYDALDLVKWRGEFMHQACETTEGTMAAVMGLDPQKIEDVVKELDTDLWVANFNSPTQVVISGTQKGIELGTVALKSAGAKKVIPLQVHGAFHSGLMREARFSMIEEINDASFRDSEIKMVCNVAGDFVEDANTIRRQLIDQIIQPVRWDRSIKAIETMGVDYYVEIGCGEVLKGLNKRNGVSVPTVSLDKISKLADLASLQPVESV